LVFLLPVLARAGDPISFKRNRGKKLALRVLISSFFRNVSSIRATHIPVQCALKSASLPILMLTFLKNSAHANGRFVPSISFFVVSALHSFD
jgi:hypothetical protein